MTKLVPKKMIVGLGFVLIVLICCFTIMMHEQAVKTERDQCFVNFANHYDVEPTFDAIGTALLAQIESELYPGINKEDVHSIFSQIAPLRPVIMGVTPDGSIVEYIFLEVCKYPDNGISYLVTYTSEEKFKKIKLYFDD